MHGCNQSDSEWFEISFVFNFVTGELSDAHDILSMKMFELEGATTKQTDEERRNAQPNSEYFESPRDHVDDPKPSSMSGNKCSEKTWFQ